MTTNETFPIGLVQNLSFTEWNETDVVQEVTSIERDFGNSKLFSSTQDLSMAITRFSLPLDAMTIMPITSANQSDFVVTVSSNTPQNNVNTFNMSGSSTFPLSSEFPILSVSDFVEVLNKTIYKAYFNLVSSISYYDPSDPSYSVGNFSYVVTDSYDFNSNINNGSRSFSFAGNLPPSSPVTYVKLEILSCQQLDSNICPPLANINLTSPSGIKVRVASSINLFRDFNGYSQITFSDGEWQPYQKTADGKPLYGSMNPVQTFTDFSTETSAPGNWTLQITPCGNNQFTIRVNFKLTIAVAPSMGLNKAKLDFPATVGFYSLDRSSGIFSLNCPEKWCKQGIRLSSTKLLKRIMSLQKNIETSPYVYTPMTSLSTTLDKTITFQAECPKMYLLCQIERILISSSNLNINRDYIDGNVSSSVITDLLVNPDDILNLDIGSYTYESSDYPMRRYLFNSNVELSRISLNVKLRYRDGSEQNIKLPPSSSLYATLSFFRVSR